MTKRHRVVLSPEALDHLTSIRAWLKGEVSPQFAAQYTADIVARCMSLRDFPLRGSPRDDIRPGMRTIPFRRRIVIAYDVEVGLVTILAIASGGRDLEKMLN